MPARRGRPMTPIDDPHNGVGRLACELGEGRSRRGLTRRELARRINRSVTTVQRAEAGEVRSTLLVAREIAGACGVGIDEIEILWKKASRLGRGHHMTDAPRLNLVRTSADLAAALRRVWEENGEPSSRQMEERAEARSKEFAPLSRMSAWRHQPDRSREVPGCRARRSLRPALGDRARLRRDQDPSTRPPGPQVAGTGRRAAGNLRAPDRASRNPGSAGRGRPPASQHRRADLIHPGPARRPPHGDLTERLSPLCPPAGPDPRARRDRSQPATSPTVP